MQEVTGSSPVSPTIAPIGEPPRSRLSGRRARGVQRHPTHAPTRPRSAAGHRAPGPASPTRWAPTFDGEGTNFAVFSRVAERVELCLFDEAGRETRVDLPEMTGFTWHGYLPGVGAGPALRLPRPRPLGPGQRACAATRSKLLLDPYARAIDGRGALGRRHPRPRARAIPSRRQEQRQRHRTSRARSS